MAQEHEVRRVYRDAPSRAGAKLGRGAELQAARNPSRDGKPPLNRQAGQKSLYFTRPHVLRAVLVVLEGEAVHPVEIGFLGPDALVLDAN